MFIVHHKHRENITHTYSFIALQECSKPDVKNPHENVI